jgi:hypothetical protein
MTDVVKPTRGDSEAVRTFRVDVPEPDIADVRRGINATRWPEREPVGDACQGVQLEMIHAVARYWGTDDDFGRLERRVNALPSVIAEIDGLDIRFIHVTCNDVGEPTEATIDAPRTGVADGGSVPAPKRVAPEMTCPTAHRVTSRSPG